MTDITRDFAWVLAQVLDGVKEHDLTDQFGIPEDECAKVMSLLAQARAYLDQPEPEGLTDEEIKDWHSRCADLTTLGEAEHYWAFDLHSDEVAGVVSAALARWGK